jgi:hypothetical protein
MLSWIVVYPLRGPLDLAFIVWIALHHSVI